VNQSSQNNLCHQIRFDSIWIKINLVSLLQRQVNSQSLWWASRLVNLLQWHSLSMQWFTHSHHSISSVNLIYLMFLCQLVSLLQWHDQNQSLQWASWFSSSESATKMLSMRWSIYSHRFIYQWINLPRVSTFNSESATMIVLFLS